MKLPRAHASRRACIVGLGLLAPLLKAEVFTYTGGGLNDPAAPVSGNWNADGNWLDSLAPSSSLDTELVFGGSGSGAYVATNNFTGAFNLNRITFDSTSTGLVTISGGTLNFLNNSGAVGPRITQNGSGAATITSTLTLSNPLTIDGTGAGLLSLTGVLSGTGSLTFNNTNGVLRLSGANTYSGGTTLTAGTLRLGLGTTGSITNGPVGTGALVLQGGRLSSDGTVARSIANAVTISGDIALGDTVNNGTLTLSGATTLSAANATLTTDSNVTISGVIGGGTNGFTKAGDGLLVLSNAGNTYTGLTTVTAGTLRASGAGTIKGNVSVAGPGATLETTVTNAIANTSDVTVSNGGNWTLNNTSQAIRKLAVGGGSADTAPGTSLVQIGTTSGTAPTLTINGTGADVIRLEGSATTPAILSLGGHGLTTGQIQLTATAPGTTTTLNFGEYGQIRSSTPAGSGNGGIFNNATTSASNYFTYNFNGTTISTPDYTGAESGPGSLYYNMVRVGDSSSQTSGYFNQVNLNASLGDGTGYLQVIKSAINLGWTGSLNLGALVTARDTATGNATNTTASTGNSNPITIRNTATGMTGGVIYGAGTLSNGPGISTGFTSLTFETAASPHTFTLGTDTSGDNPANNVALIDVRVRNTATGAGAITQNNVSLLLDGGVLRGNSLVSSNAGVTLRNGGELVLANDTGAYTVSTTGVGANNRTIFMDGSGAGTFTLGGSGTSAISIATQSGSGTWSGGIINANGGHTINDGAGGISATSTAGFFTNYTIAARSGFNGIAMANASPFATSAAGVAPTVRMTLGEGSTFLARNTTAASGPGSYYIGETATLAALAPTTINNVGIATAATGSFMFGLNQANGTQASLTDRSLTLNGDGTATLALGTATPVSRGLTVGGPLILGNTGTSYYNGAFVITAIDGNNVTFALRGTPPNTGTITLNTGTTITNSQSLVLLRDKGSSDISLLANTTGGKVHIAADQSGSGNLYANAGAIVIDQGVTFDGTGGLYSGTVVAGSGWINSGGNTLYTNNIGTYGTINGSAGTNTLLSIHGALGSSASDNITVSLNAYLGTGNNGGGSGVFVGSTASLAGTQQWTVATPTSASVFHAYFQNHLTDASRWNADVSLTVQGNSGLLEASTNTATPGSSDNFKFASLSLNGAGTQHIGVIKLSNDVQNDGGSGKEALYVGTFNPGGNDGSGGTILLNLNGQDLWFDHYSPSTSRAFSLVNDATGTTSVVHNFGAPTTQAPFAIGGFRVLNGATIETHAGDWYGIIFNRNVGGYVADTASAPNGANGTDVRTTLGAQNAAANAASFTSFLGSGSTTGGNGNTTGAGTDGTFRVIGGDFKASNYILNPVGTTGTLSTTGDGDATLNQVLIRSNAAQTFTAANGSSWLTLSDSQLYSVGDIVQFSANVSGFSTGTVYYVVGVDGNQLQLSATPGGTALVANANNSSTTITIQDPGGAADTTAAAALVVAGTANIDGHLVFARAPGAVYQSTLRVGGIDPTTGLAHASTATLNVTGDLTVGSTNNLAIQSNGTVKVGGNVDIQGVGVNVSATSSSVTAAITGTGVGIHANSHFTLNGNHGSATPQTVNIVPNVGYFHVGDGSAGVLAGTAAQARLTTNLTSVSGMDINGSASRLDLGGRTLSVGGVGLAVGGSLTGTGTVIGATSVVAGGSLHAADQVGLIAFSNGVTLLEGSAIRLAINGATTRGTDYSGVDFNGSLSLAGTSLTFNFGTTLADTTVLNLFDGAALAPAFASVTASGSYTGSFVLNETNTAYVGVFGAQELTLTLATGELSFAASSVIPEPASAVALAAAGALLVAALRRRRRD